MKMILAIAAGGALGAVARHYFAATVMKAADTGFPWGILAANVVGSILLGIIVQVFMTLTTPQPELRAFLVVGLLGAFTTFSTFSLDVVLLIERGEIGLAGLYIMASVVLAVGGLFVGMVGVRTLL